MLKTWVVVALTGSRTLLPRLPLWGQDLRRSLIHSVHCTRAFGSTTSQAAGRMPRGVKKENLPTKTCVVCNRPFTWRKKWERCWDEVTTCSKGCNARRRGHGKKDDTSGVTEEGSVSS
jgi:hypothetical protein